MRKIVLLTDSVMILVLMLGIKNSSVGCMIAAIILATLTLGANVAELTEGRKR